MTGSAIVVGHGSIGVRHARILSDLGLEVGIVSRRQAVPGAYPDLATALAAEAPDYVVIANETALHGAALDALAASRFDGKVLVEKPLFAGPRPLPDHRFRAAWVGYNLRFHPVVRALKRWLADETPICAHLHVGQYLPTWRPERPYPETCSAHAGGGGGVLRDLSHELDLATWLFGEWKRLTAIGGRLGNLAIDSDDCWTVLVALERCAATSIHLNYLDRSARREIRLNTGDHTATADLIAGTLDIDGAVETFAMDRDGTYRTQHRAILEGNDRDLCGLSSGAAVVGMIDAIEEAARHETWIRP